MESPAVNVQAIAAVEIPATSAKPTASVESRATIAKLIATYGVVKLKNGEAQIRVCFREEIEESKASSRGSHKSDSPWRNHYEAMALVVPIRKMGKNLGLPLKIEDFGEASNV